MSTKLTIQKLAAVSTILLTACTTGAGTSTVNEQTTAQNWQVDNARSNFTFVTTKAGQPGTNAITEVSSFKRVAGSVTSQGQIELLVDLTSIDTGFEIRDDRVKAMLFNVGATPQAKFAAKIEANTIRSIPANGFKDVEVAGQLTIAAQTKPVVAKLRVSQLGTGALQVATIAPIVINANDYGIGTGVEALRDIMGLNLLSPAAPVSFNLVMSAKY